MAGLGFMLASSLALQAHAAPVVVGGPGPVSPFAGTVLDFEGLTEAAIIANLGGVAFTQTGGGSPMIDNKSFLFAYESISGVGVLTGSAEGGNVATTAGIIATFSQPLSQVGAFFSDTAPLGDYLIQVFGAGGVFLESVLITGASLPAIGNAACDGASPWDGTGCGIFVGFNRPQGDIFSIQFGPSSAGAGSDAFAIDDLTFQLAAVPEPATLLLLVTGFTAAAVLRRRHARGQHRE